MVHGSTFFSFFFSFVQFDCHSNLVTFIQSSRIHKIGKYQRASHISLIIKFDYTQGSYYPLFSMTYLRKKIVIQVTDFQSDSD